ncbi:hypothetical protein BM221_010739 [Beauveria bassiana]|uniref:Uncharacterized protein n=1 Tax=Beauveria bassiana TaxID=176275 RepID=A0A2N6N7Y4_BEABA|nr:hypothetical protein BM221_010739 [Beauveria bassiana]
MTARAFLTGHTRREKEAARKRGPSLQDKTKQLGAKANIRTLTLYEDPTHGFWHIAKHCPHGKTFPDIGRLVAFRVLRAAKHGTYNIAQVDEFTKTGKRPTVRDVSGRRPSPSAAVSGNTDSSCRRRSTRNAPKTNQSIYDVPEDDDSETLCSASILYKPRSSECEEWDDDESTVGDASTVEAANTAEEADAMGEDDAMGEANATEHDAIGEANTVAEADNVAADNAAGGNAVDGNAAELEQMDWEAEYTTGMKDTLGWTADDTTGMETTLLWEAENTTSVEGLLAWEPEIDLEGWDACTPETQGQDSRGNSSVVATMVDQHPLSTSTRHHKTQKEELSNKWAAFALAEAVALQRRYIYCLW